jgi:hypothetical protein
MPHMASQETLLPPGTKDVETRPALYLVADADVDRFQGYVGVLFRYTNVQGADGALRKELQESHFLMSSSEACELRDRLDQALAGVRAIAYH